MPIDTTFSLPVGDDLDRGIANLLTDPIRRTNADDAALLRLACRGFAAQGVVRAVVAFHAWAGDKDIDGTTCWDAERVITHASWSKAPQASKDLPEAIATAVDNLQNVVYSEMPSWGRTSERLFGWATLDVAERRLLFHCRHEPEAGQYVEQHLVRDQLPETLRALHARLMEVLPLAEPYGHLAIRGSAWEGWQLNSHIATGSQTPPYLLPLTSVQIDALLATIGVDLIDIVRLLLRHLGIARPFGHGNCSVGRNGFFVSWGHCTGPLQDERWVVR
jgi:hypothetical protein